MTEAEVQVLIEVGDYMVNEATGEILGLIPEKARFAVTDRASAEWVLSKLMDAESEIAALERRKALLTENIDSMRKEHEHRAAWLRARFGPELEAWAHSELKGGKTRTVKTPFGRLSFRKLKARLVVHDEVKALEWAKQNQPHAVKVTEKVLLSMLEATGEDFEPPGFIIEPERESFSIQTGVES